MEKLSNFILKHKITILCIFVIVTILNFIFINDVKINYNLSKYLPEDTPSLIAVEKMNKYYDSFIPNIKVMIPDVSIEEVISYKEKIKNIDNVNEVLWADNYFNLLDHNIDISQLSEWYKDDNALFLINIKTNNSLSTINEIKSVIKDKSLVAGEAVNAAIIQNNIGSEINNIMIFVIPIILIILLITTSSWLEPILFLLTIGISIIINMGTNIIFGEISYITQAAVGVLQLAVSMDYAIFLLHRFASLRHEGNNVETAMKVAIKDSTSTILASALTTILGFLALVVMKFGVGADLGIVLAKGIIFSLLSVLLLLPILVVLTYKIIDKTHHKSLLPSFKRIGNGIVKVKYITLIIVLLLMVPSFIASQNNKFLYGSSGINGKESQVYKNSEIINKEFGINNQMVLLAPIDNNKEIEIVNELSNLKHIKGINSFVTTFGVNTPIEYLPKEAVSQFISEKYSRIVIKSDLEEEGEETFKLIDEIKKIASTNYDSYHLAGISAVNYDIKQIVTKDNILVNILAVVFILLVLIITFKSFITPLILIITIETAIWINLSIAYLSLNELNYIGYLIISTVQLGATVDYAILFAKKYFNRKDNPDKKKACIETIEETAPSILSSAFILAIAGFSLGFISSNQVISELGILIGRGSLISAIMVLLFLPSMFILLRRKVNNSK